MSRTNTFAYVIDGAVRAYRLVENDVRLIVADESDPAELLVDGLEYYVTRFGHLLCPFR
jgi:hypothetical protein